MKKIVFISGFLLFFLSTKAQVSENSVGINTLEPQAMLDVNGNVRIQTVEEAEFNEIESILVIDPNTNIIKSLTKEQILDPKNKIFALIEKGDSQRIPLMGVDNRVPVVFNGDISGLNSNEIVLNSTKTELSFPANRVFKITGNIGVLYQSPENPTGNPGYISSRFEGVGNGIDIVFSSLGYTESSTELYDDGGVTDPTILFFTGQNGGTVKLMVSYGVIPGGYYLAGTPTDSQVGTYITIQEL